MKSFIRRANIVKFRRILETTINEEQRRTLLKLLAEEERLLAEAKPKTE